MVPVSGGFAKKIWGEPGKYNGWLSDWSPDGNTLLICDSGVAYRTVVAELDLHLLTLTKFLDDPEFGFDHPHFSSDGRWVTFTGIHEGSSCVYVAPFRRELMPRNGWIRVTDTGQDGRPHFSHDDKLVFFTSGRDGFRCIWGQKLGSDMHPAGSPFAVYHFHQPRRLLGYGNIGRLRVEVGPNILVFDQTELTGNIWLLDPAKRGTHETR